MSGGSRAWIRGIAGTAGLLALCACAGGPRRAVAPPPPAAPSGAAALEAPSTSPKGYRICRTRTCKGGDPKRRQYFDERRRRYYFFDPVRKRYYWEDGSPRA